MADNDDKIPPQADRTPPPVALGAPPAEDRGRDSQEIGAVPTGKSGPAGQAAQASKERRRRARGRVISIDEAEALAAWDKSAAFGGDNDEGEGGATEPPAPDSTDLVLDVSEEHTLLAGLSSGEALGGPSGGFAGELPREPIAVAIDADLLGFAPRASDFRPHAVAQALAAEIEVQVNEDGITEIDLAATPQAALEPRAQLHLLVEELALLSREPSPGTPAEIARTSAAAARAAERIGSADALRFYQQALAADPHFAPALRGQFRLLWRAGLVDEAVAIAAALGASLPGDREAYAAWVSEAQPTQGRPSASLAVALTDLERSLNPDVDDRTAAIEPAERLGEQLGGEAGAALHAFAQTVRQLSAGGPAAAVAPESLATPGQSSLAACADLRRALTLPPGEAIALVAGAAQNLPSSPLTPALWRLAARLARRAGDHPRAQALLLRARAAGAALLPALEGVDVASDDVQDGAVPGLDLLRDRLAAVPAETVTLVAARLGGRLLDADRAADAITLLDEAQKRDPASGPALAPLVSRLLVKIGTGAAGASWGEVPRAARDLLGAIDARRRPELGLGATLATLLDPETRAVGLGQLAQAGLAQLIDRAGSAPDPALAWWLSWQLRGSDRAAAASTALTAAADRWSESSPALSAALYTRGAALEAAADPKEFAAALPVNRFAESTVDDPADLVREMIAPGRDARTIATRFRNAAGVVTGGSSGADAGSDGGALLGSPFRIYEAAGWAIQAGAFAEALAGLYAAPSAARSTPLGRQLLRRLVRLGDDHHVAEAALRDVAAASADPRTRALYEHLAADILARTGQGPAAAALYRELLAGPLAKDADLGLRRTLFALRDGDALMDFWRDEFDARSGAGRDQAAAAAAVEKARVALDLFEDRARAADEIAAALALDPDLLPARVLALCHVAGLGGSQQRKVQLERLVQDMPGQQTAVGFLAALVADAEGEGETALRLLKAAVLASPSAPLALMRRYVAVIERRGPREADFAGVLAAAADRLVHTAGADPRLSTTVFLRAAELAEAGGDRARAETLTERARGLSPDDLPALVRLARLQLGRGDFTSALRHLEAQAAALRDPGRKAATLFQAGSIASDNLGDDARARPLLTKVLDLEPQHAGAFLRLRKMLERTSDAAALAALLARRAQAIAPAGAAGLAEALALRSERAQLLATRLGDRPGAKRELGEALALDQENLVALGALAALEIDDGNFAIAAELTLRQSRFEHDPARLVDCFLRLGRLYRDGARTGVGDLPAAAGAYEKVLEVDPDNREALAALSEVYALHGEPRRGILITERLLEPETDPVRRRPLLLRLGLLWEASGDARRAAVCLRHAAEASPRDLQTLGELVRFHDRHKDVAARNLLLDGGIALLRADFRAGREPVQALRTLVSLLQWRGRPVAAQAAAQLLGRLATDASVRAEAATAVQALAGQLAAPSLKEAAADDRAMPREVPPGLAHVLRTLGPALARSNKPDLRRFDVSRADRQGRSSALRAAFDPLALELGVRDFDAYVAVNQAHALAIEPGDPPALIVGAGIAAQGPLAIRFAAGYCLRLCETHFAFLLRDGPIEAAALIAGLVRQFLPDHRPPYLPEAALRAADARVGKALNRSLRTELAPLATQLAAGCSPEELFTAAHEVGARMGLIACGDLLTALDVVAAFAGRPDAPVSALMELPLVAHLIDFALSEDHDALVSAADAGNTAPS